VIIDIIKNYLQSSIINEAIKIANLPRNMALAINVMMNLDQISIVQWGLAQLGVYKFWCYAIWFVFLA
jgi:hypothetical protein